MTNNNIKLFAAEAYDLWMADSPDCPTYEDISDCVIEVLNKHEVEPTRIDCPIFQQVLRALPAGNWTAL